MTRSCALLSAMPCDRAAAERMFSNATTGSFAEEWIRSQSQHLTQTDLVQGYLEVVPRTWDEVAQVLDRLDVTMIPNATSGDLAGAFATHDIVAVLAHHVEDTQGQPVGIQFSDRTIDSRELEAIAPTRPAIVHLGVCRSARFTEPLKACCGRVRVISSQAQVEPEFFLRAFARTVQLWRKAGGDYVQTHVDVRLAMLDVLGARK